MSTFLMNASQSQMILFGIVCVVIYAIADICEHVYDKEEND